MKIFDYSLNDLLFAFWFSRKREIMSDDAYFHRGYSVPKWMDDRLNELRQLKNPNASIYILE
jgi:hypothetical protein